jgi:two-component system, OmpR family, alkaline phosphatase synthesis response regulator PhoP
VTTEQKSILIIEDEEALRATLSCRLRGEGYLVDTISEGIDGFETAVGMPFDLIILDIMMPGRSWGDVCRNIRQVGMATPILLLASHSQKTDAVLGLRLGADDFVTKPFNAAELLARIEALLRRAPSRFCHGVHQIGSIKVDLRRAEVTRDGKPVYMAAREFQLLRYLIERPGTSISRKELLRAVWGYATDAMTRTIDMHVSSLREKLETNPKYPELILTVAKVGYKFADSRNI